MRPKLRDPNDGCATTDRTLEASFVILKKKKQYWQHSIIEVDEGWVEKTSEEVLVNQTAKKKVRIRFLRYRVDNLKVPVSSALYRGLFLPNFFLNACQSWDLNSKSLLGWHHIFFEKQLPQGGHAPPVRSAVSRKRLSIGFKMILPEKSLVAKFNHARVTTQDAVVWVPG